MRVLLLLMLLAGACREESSERCATVCNQEADCTDDSDSESAFDERDCVEACAALERATYTAGLVDKHAECVAQAAGNCAQIVRCH